ncbi:hypothetical protein H8S90_13570 [Olivibacter sp. SDN3]|uniref:hypothetical protein n=1 Tax=Olivibacter sp. SDN3 TaxID=2764720 RepID=UPI001651A984|nr:hypothetical protein [Olivibacter sp. SDN3]QNL47850.1 hypothetical protein H8S90_13570 [Olivibacter sp. SDN3]
MNSKILSDNTVKTVITENFDYKEIDGLGSGKKKQVFANKPLLKDFDNQYEEKKRYSVCFRLFGKSESRWHTYSRWIYNIVF